MTTGPAPYEPGPPGQPMTRSCVSCGRSIDWSANVCPYCGHDFRVPLQVAQAKPKSMLPVAGGILIVIAGILAIALGVFYFALDVSDIEESGAALPPGWSAQDVQDIMYVCGAIFMVFGIIALLGGIFAIQRKHFAVAVIGGIFALLGIGFLLGSVLGLIGLILIAVGRKDFD